MTEFNKHAEQAQIVSYLQQKGLAKADRMENAQVAQDFLSKDKRAIKSYLVVDLEKTFSSSDVKEFQLAYVNLVPKVLKNITLLYKSPAKRAIEGDKGGSERLNDALNKTSYDKFMRDIHKGVKLHNTVLGGTVPDGMGGVRHMILRPDLADVTENPNNFLEIGSLKYPVMRMIDGHEEVVYEYWSDTEYKWLNANDVQIVTDGAPIDNEGHPGFNPFMPFRLEDQNDFWGDGMGDFVDANRYINFIMTSALGENIVMSGFGQLVGTNLGKTEIKIGPRHPILADEVTNDMVPPKLENVAGTPMIEELQGVIDWMQKVQGMLQGMPASSFSEAQEIMSGYAKMMDSLELIEDRDADALVFRVAEARYLGKFAGVYNKTAQGEKPLPASEGGKPIENLIIEFAPISFPQNSTEINEKWRGRIEAGVANQLDWIQTDLYPGITREKAEKIFLRIQKENVSLKLTARGSAPNSDDIPEDD